MKRILRNLAVVLLVFMQFGMLMPQKAEALATEKRLFMVSAYYSPLPNQRFYMRGNYEADKILNGRGTNGADGTEVYVGMLAAPRNYPFGSKIEIPGLGVGVVHDRGGAIIARQNYDRIDVWMGRGEEGLSRALNWGMRLVEGRLDKTGHSLVQQLNFNWLNKELPESTLKKLMAKSTVNTISISKPINTSSPKLDVKELQETLRLLGYYHGVISGEYDADTKEAVTLFQLNEGIIFNQLDSGSGIFGPKTSSVFQLRVDELNSGILRQQNLLKINLKNLTTGLGKDSSGDKVMQLQKMLWELGYYRGPFHDQYDVMTTEAVFEFQKDYGIIKDESNGGAGYFGPKTHQTLTAAINKKADLLAEGAKELQSWVPSSNPLPKLSELKASSSELKGLSLAFGILEEKPKFAFKKNLDLNAKGDEVIQLQNKLIEEGFLAEGLNTGYFGWNTREALVKFQLKKGIIKSISDVGAGRAGPGTRRVLNAL